MAGTAGAVPAVGYAANVPAAPVASPGAYWLVSSDGGIFTFGGVPFAGSAGGQHLSAPVIGMAATPDGLGYWIYTRAGAVYTFGDATYHGALTGLPPAARPSAPVIGFAPTPDGGGYWIATANGGIYTFGDAQFFGSRAGQKDYAPIASMAVTSDGGGYWLAGADGALYTFGDAPFLGGANTHRLTSPIIKIAADPAGGGYWMVAADGGVFTFGAAPFLGSTGGLKLNKPIVDMAPTADGAGYWMVASDGGIFTFGDAAYRGSTGGKKLNASIVGIAVGHTSDPYTPGATGFDISWPQCGGALPSGGAFTVVGVNDGKAFTHNPCFASEVASVGPTLSVYMNLDAPPAGSSEGLTGPAGACTGNNTGCIAYNYGYNAAMDSVGTAAAAGVTAGMWWLDIETANTWDSNQFNNSRTIQGALDALTQAGAVAGIYSTPHQFGIIAGSYAPATPLWVATGSVQATAVDYCSPDHAFAGGTPWLTQFQSGGVPYDQDYACPVT